MKNKTRAIAWIRMAEDDLKDAIRDLRDKSYPSSVFHSQQCCEKACKALLNFFAIKSGKSHFPASIIEDQILRGNKYGLRDPELKKLSEIVDLSKPLESQKEFPRYGIETKEKIILPSELYDKDKAKSFLSSAKEVLKIARDFIYKK